MISIVLPALNEEAALPATLASIARQNSVPPFEVILVDGGSTDLTISVFTGMTRGWTTRGVPARVVKSSRAGRAVQMNDGVAESRGNIILFLHADTTLPGGALQAVAKTMADPSVCGGGFSLGYTDGGALLGLIASWATLRSRLCLVHYGDQAPFVRRSVLERIGGVPEIDLFEDLELARAMRRAGRVVSLSLRVGTSARRLRQGGIVRTALHFAWTKLRYALGNDPGRLAGRYRNVR